MHFLLSGYRMESKVAWMSRPLTIVRFMVATVERKGQASYDSGLVTLDPADSGVHPRYDHDGAAWLTIKIRCEMFEYTLIETFVCDGDLVRYIVACWRSCAQVRLNIWDIIAWKRKRHAREKRSLRKRRLKCNFLVLQLVSFFSCLQSSSEKKLIAWRN